MKGMDKRELLRRLREQIRTDLQGMCQIGDVELYACIDQAIAREGEHQYLTLARKLELKHRLYDAFRRLDILQDK